MIVSALLTSVGINTALCILFFAVYSVLRKQPSYYQVYIPRLLGEGSNWQRTSFNLRRLIPSPDWIAKAWSLSEDELFLLSGLDGLVFMRMITFSLKIFTFAGVIGMLMLLPIHCYGNQLQVFDIDDFAGNSLDVFTISNVNSGSSWLWVHFIAVYFVTGFTCLQLHHEYKYIASKRLSYFYSSKPQLHQFTILVHSIPTSSSCSISETVENFFKELYPSTYLSHVVIHRKHKIQSFLSKANYLYRRIARSSSDPTQQKHKPDGSFGFFGSNDNHIDHYGKKLEEIEQNFRQEARAAFVFFKSRYGAATAFHLQQSVNPTQWVTEPAPEPRDVYWPFFSESFLRKWISKLVVIVVSILFTVSFLIPVVIVQGLTNLGQLEVLFPFLTSILAIKFVAQVVTGYLPSLILQLSLRMVPPVMGFLSSIQGYISYSDLQMSASKKVLWFTIWNVFFATVFSGSVFYQLSVVLDLKDIPEKLAVAVPAQASFFISYVATTGWTTVSAELFQIFPLICSLIKRPFSRSEDIFEAKPRSFDYHKDVPRVLFFGLLGIAYFFLAPLILPFLLIYLCLAYIIYRNQFINVNAPKYETAGRFWPIVHDSMIFALVLMQIIAVGSFALKKLSSASTWMLPLPVFTLLFNQYCRKRFLPIFTAYSAESLIKRDREDLKDATMDEFYEQLITAYKDPALFPIQHSTSTDSLATPLLS